MSKTYKDWYLEGYEAGLREAWEEVARMAARGHTAKEIQLYFRSRKASIHQSLKKKEMDIAREGEPMLQMHPYPNPSQKREGAPTQGVSGAVVGAEIGSSPYAVPQQSPQNQSRPRMPVSKRGFSYLVKEDKLDKSYEMFRAVMDQGHPGICITRTHPNHLRDMYGMEETKIVWLTSTDSVRPAYPSSMGISAVQEDMEERVQPGNITRLTTIIVRFLADNKTTGGAILFDGLEYLITQNQGFDKILRFIQFINERVAESGGILIMPAGRDLKPEWYSMLRKELTEEV
ncbi:MAG: DUF835 domain-containing protein [Candidatus Thermoplasmatota archaeon]|nr:DUF835 domain-containing protein [Candidatus Thermoplasmatota archaeon]